MNPEEILSREAFSQPHRTIATEDNHQEDQVKALSRALKEMMKRELLNSQQNAQPRVYQKVY
jgi:hypothetical protein